MIRIFAIISACQPPTMSLPTAVAEATCRQPVSVYIVARSCPSFRCRIISNIYAQRSLLPSFISVFGTRALYTRSPQTSSTKPSSFTASQLVQVNPPGQNLVDTLAGLNPKDLSKNLFSLLFVGHGAGKAQDAARVGVTAELIAELAEGQ